MKSVCREETRLTLNRLTRSVCAEVTRKSEPQDSRGLHMDQKKCSKKWMIVAVRDYTTSNSPRSSTNTQLQKTKKGSRKLKLRFLEVRSTVRDGVF